MIVDELAYQIRQTFGFVPTAEQAVAIDTFCRFLTDVGDRPAMVMRGSAGTGKTSLAAAIVKTLVRLGQKVVLLAPTGRAAKVFSLNAGQRALTVHRRIYRQKAFTGEMSGFNLNANLAQDTLFIVDEASMVANESPGGTVLDREEELTTGDILMVVKNNYYWPERERGSEKLKVKSEQSISLKGKGGVGQVDCSLSTFNFSLKDSFIANGDRAVVQRVRNVRELYGFRFADVWLRFPDYDDYEMQVTVLLDTLASDAPALTRQQGEQLFNAVLDDYQDVPLKADRMKCIRQDMYYNALQVKYAYAVTCHKAQGGQWAHVYIDQGYMTDEMLTPDYIHWLYTAFTRATERLYLVNWPKTQTIE